MKNALIVLLLLVIAAGVATYSRYQSFHPCDWMEQDLADSSGLPRLAMRAQIRAEFVLKGITEPGPTDCVLAWWDYRANRDEGGT